MENILAKTDKSMAPNPTAGAVPKREKFAWTTESDPGAFMMVPKKDLNIDGTYQRGEVSKAKVLEIAKKWDWKLFGALSVVMREDGTLWVYDGGHRTRAAFYRDDIADLPCMVFEVKTRIDEAKAFVGANTMKSNVSAFHVYRASVKAKEPVALATQAILQKFGYEATQDGKKAFGFSAIATLKNLVAEDAKLAEKVFSVCAEIAVDGEQTPAGTFRGLFVLAKKLDGKVDILANGHKETLVKRGIAGIEAAIRREKHIAGQGGQLVEAKAILDLLNHGKRRKLHW